LKIFLINKDLFLFLSLSDPAVAPTKPIQHITTADNSLWRNEPKGRFDTTYRAEYINRIRNKVCITSYHSLILFFHMQNKQTSLLKTIFLFFCMHI
jgi:hypothetical protein